VQRLTDPLKYTYRERCFEEHGQICVLCESEERVEAHHIDGDRRNNQVDNLISVCKECHSDIHSTRERHSEWTRKLNPPHKRSVWPDIDISNAIDGRVRDFALDEGLYLTEAYELVLNRALRAKGYDLNQSRLSSFERKDGRWP